MLKSLYRFISPRFQNLFFEYKTDMKPRNGVGKGGSHPQLLEIVEEHRKGYESILDSCLEYTETFHGIESSEKDADLPFWNNGFLPGLDIVAIYTMMRLFKPKQYVEIGSGNSTKVVRRAIVDGELNTHLTSIDPFPRATIDHLSDTIIRMPLEKMEDHSIFEGLEEGDILFIDNSHRCLPNSDVTVCFLEIVPRLRKGVIVHVHDIYIPFDYPQFMCDRAYSEQYVLAAMLLANSEKFKTILPNYFISQDEDLSSRIARIWKHPNLKGVEQHGGSYWFQIT